MHDDLTKPVDPDDLEFYAFVAAYQDALAAGRAPPPLDNLMPELRPRWQRLQGMVLRLHRARGTATPASLLAGR